MTFPYVNPDVRYVGTSWLRRMNASSAFELKYPVVVKRESGEELVVVIPWQTYLVLQQAALQEAQHG